MPIWCSLGFKTTYRGSDNKGYGTFINVSRKHKLTIGSSAESELVGIVNVLGIMILSTYFIETQCYTFENNVLYQDTNVTVLLVKKDSMLTDMATKHIKNMFFSLSLIRSHKMALLYNTGSQN